MDYFRAKRFNAHEPLDDERPAKRISTPAGQRLSMVIESTHAKVSSATKSKSKINVTTTSTYCNDPTHQHIEPVQHVQHKSTKLAGMMSVLTGGRLHTPHGSSGDRTPNGSNLSVSVWSDKDAEKFGHIRQQKRRGGWGRKRLAIIAGVVLALIIALAVGLALGTKKKSSSSTSPSLATSGAQPAATQPSTGTSVEADKPSTPTASAVPLPSGFPTGSYSLVAFLDTVTTTCVADVAAWACPPNTNYYSDPQKALTVFNWDISGSSGSYKISLKGQDVLGTTFQNEKLELLDAGKDTERYRFMLSRAKTVNMTGSLGDQQGDFECDYPATTIQGSLYTKLAKTYPQDTIAVGTVPNPVWPFAARVEQSVGGGESVPACKKKSGNTVISGLKAQDPTSLCACLYKNWTPAPPQ